VKPTSSPNDPKIIEILESLKSSTAEYPPELLAARRASFISQIAQRRAVGAKEAQPTKSRKVFEILESLKAAEAKYPAELLAARRAAFQSEVAQRREALEEEETTQHVIEALESLQSSKVEYPAELLAARRAAFIRQIGERSEVHSAEGAEPGPEIVKLFERLKTADTEYPPRLLAARRARFVRQIRGWGSFSLLDAFYSALRNGLSFISSIPLAPTMKAMRTSLVVVTMLVATFLASLLGNRPLFAGVTNPSPTQVEVSRPAAGSPTSTQELQTTICKPGYAPPLCLAKKFDTSEDLTYQGNGARPAVAKDTVPGHSDIHQPEYVNDGHYGNGSSWISNSAYSWIKIDLGQVTAINTVEFGRDRLGNLSDRSLGQFTIAVALSDNIYADGNSSNDLIEYTLVYDSERAGFTGNVSGAQTVTAQFDSVSARFVKITFENPGTAIDEVEVFMIQPTFVESGNPTRRPNNQPSRPTSTPIPTNTVRPTNTSTPVPTNTPTDTPTDTPAPTDTPVPTDTPEPTNTPTDIPTMTPTDAPTNTMSPTELVADLASDTPSPELAP
jgi:hypothetical protein